MGHAITTLTPLRVREYHRGGDAIGYAVSGMPADCVKLAIGTLLDRPPDLVVSGINLGPNTATNVIYSGTVSAATEARILGILSMAVSLGTLTDPDFSYAAVLTRRIAGLVLEHGLPRKVLLNVNVPPLSRREIRGIRISHQGDSAFVEDFSVREDPRKQPYYWLAGAYTVTDTDEATDAWALANGFVSVTPIQYDLTAHSFMEDLRSWRWRA